jgi:hypothetical protein
MVMSAEHAVEQELAGETEVLGEKPALLSLCSPQIQHDLTWARSRAAAVGSRRLTAWAMARPFTEKLVSRQNYIWEWKTCPEHPSDKHMGLRLGWRDIRVCSTHRSLVDSTFLYKWRTSSSHYIRNYCLSLISRPNIILSSSFQKKEPQERLSFIHIIHRLGVL